METIQEDLYRTYPQEMQRSVMLNYLRRMPIEKLKVLTNFKLLTSDDVDHSKNNDRRDDLLRPGHVMMMCENIL